MITKLAGNIIIKDSKLLLLYRPEKNHWEVPGGKVKEDESATKAAVREAREEINVDVELERPFYTGEFQHENKIFEWNGYIASIKEGRPQIKEEKFEELKWFSAEELSECNNLASNIRMVEKGIMRLLK